MSRLEKTEREVYRGLDKDISCLPLWSRPLTFLRKNRINTIGELAEITEEELLNCNGIGEEIVNDIKEALSLYDLGLKGKPYRRREEAERYYFSAVEEGKSIEEMAEERGISVGEAYKILLHLNLLYKYESLHGPLKRVPFSELEKVVLGEKSVSEVSRQYVISKERVRQIIKISGLYELFREFRKMRLEDSKKEREELKKHRSLIANLIYKHVLEISKNNRPLHAAVKHYLTRTKRGRKKLQLPVLKEFFERYYGAKESRDKPTLKKLSAGLDMFFTTAGRVLKQAGELPLKRPEYKRKYSLSKREQDIVKASFKIKTGLSYKDMERFTGIPYRFFSNYRFRNRIKRNKNKNLPLNLTYAKAVDFLEATDAGFGIEESMEYAGLVSKKQADYIIAHRNAIEYEIRRFKKAVGLLRTQEY